MYDIAIIGAGPAGSTLARLICDKYKVLLIDKRQLDKGPENDYVVKACGGLVAPDAQKILAELELGLPKSVLVGPQLFTVRTIDLQNKLERYYQRFYINIDRERFDRWLVSLVPNSVDKHFGSSFKLYGKTENGFSVKLIKDGEMYTETAKMIVGADGAYSLVRRQLFPRVEFKKTYISPQEWFEVEKPLPYFSAIFDSEITDFYSWTIPKENHLIIGTALKPGVDAAVKFELLKRKLGNYGFKMGKSVMKEGAFILRPSSTSQIRIGMGRIFFIGEAAGWISPSSAEGLSYAFRSALALAKSLQHGPKDAYQGYLKASMPMRLNIVMKNLKSPFMYHPWLRNIVMTSGLDSINVCK